MKRLPSLDYVGASSGFAFATDDVTSKDFEETYRRLDKPVCACRHCHATYHHHAPVSRTPVPGR